MQQGKRLAALSKRNPFPLYSRHFSVAAKNVELEFEPDVIPNVVITEAWTHPKIEKSQDLLAKGAELLAQGVSEKFDNTKHLPKQ